MSKFYDLLTTGKGQQKDTAEPPKADQWLDIQQTRSGEIPSQDINRSDNSGKNINGNGNGNGAFKTLASTDIGVEAEVDSSIPVTPEPAFYNYRQATIRGSEK